MVETLKSHRLDGIGEYYFSKKLREIEQLKQAGADILNLGIGSPDLSPPPIVNEALTHSLSDPGAHRYQSYKGLPELRAAYADWYKKFYDASLNPESEILPLIGSKEGIMHICMAFLNQGDEVLIPNPGYPTYPAAVKLAGGTPKAYDLLEKSNYQPDLDLLSQQDLTKVKLMFVNYPHMPTGKNASTVLFEKLRKFCSQHEIILINDNPYSFILTDKPRSILKGRRDGDLVVELNSLSKSHNMSGWRMGVLCGHSDLIDQVLTFKSNMDSGMFKPLMTASIKALEVGATWFEELNDEYTKRRKIVLCILDELGCVYQKEQVGMFVWARIPAGKKNGTDYADWLLNTYKFFIPPGMIFGSNGDQYIRISLCSNQELLNTALDRITGKKTEL